MTERLWIYGASGHGKVVAEAARRQGTYEVVGFLDDDPARRGTETGGVPVIGSLGSTGGEPRFDGGLSLGSTGGEPRFDGGLSLDDPARPPAGSLVALGVGGNQARKAVLDRLVAAGFRPAVVVHPTAVLAGDARLGEGTFVGALAVVQPGARIGRGCIVNTAAVVEHDCVLEDFVHVSPRSALAGGVSLREGAHLGLGAVVLPGLEVGSWTTVGAGGVVTRSLGAALLAVGVPARAMGGQRD